MSCSKRLVENSVEPEVFQDMANFPTLADQSKVQNAIRITFPKFTRGLSTSDFETFINNVVGKDNVLALGRLAFPNEWHMIIKDNEIRETLIRQNRTKINNRTCFITPFSSSEIRGYIHWLPLTVDELILKNLLREYGELILFEQQETKLWDITFRNDSKYFAVFLKQGQTKEDIPHFIRIDGYTGLITIKGRSPACFHCKEIGHKKSDCKKYREKLSDYCMRPSNSGKPRTKPRGRRYKPHSQLKNVSANESAEAAPQQEGGSEKQKKKRKRHNKKKNSEANPSNAESVSSTSCNPNLLADAKPLAVAEPTNVTQVSDRQQVVKTTEDSKNQPSALVTDVQATSSTVSGQRVTTSSSPTGVMPLSAADAKESKPFAECKKVDMPTPNFQEQILALKQKCAEAAAVGDGVAHVPMEIIENLLKNFSIAGGEQNVEEKNELEQLPVSGSGATETKKKKKKKNKK